MINTIETWIATCDYKECKEHIRDESNYRLREVMRLSGWKENKDKTYCEKHANRKSVHLLENTSQTLKYVHPLYLCKGRVCVIHNRTDHHMRSWPQNWRVDRQFMERTCSHGVGHPDPDQWEYLVWRMGELGARMEFVHGCDGCCSKEKK